MSESEMEEKCVVPSRVNTWAPDLKGSSVSWQFAPQKIVRGTRVNLIAQRARVELSRSWNEAKKKKKSGAGEEPCCGLLSETK